MSDPPDEDRPAFSVVVPVFGQPAPLADCLEALAEYDEERLPECLDAATGIEQYWIVNVLDRQIEVYGSRPVRALLNAVTPIVEAIPRRPIF